MLPLPTYYIHIVIDIYPSFLAKPYACDSFFFAKNDLVFCHFKMKSSYTDATFANPCVRLLWHFLGNFTLN